MCVAGQLEDLGTFASPKIPDLQFNWAVGPEQAETWRQWKDNFSLKHLVLDHYSAWNSHH